MSEPVPVSDPSDLDFTGRVVLVTGGARGVGRGICRAFAARGATVVICGRSEPPVDSLPERTEFIGCDVREAEAVSALVDAVVDRHGRLDVAVNNAGGAPYAVAATASPRFHISIITLNLIAALHVAQRANSVMQAQTDGGNIINVASVSGMRPSPGTAAYGAAKAGIISLTQTLAVEWAPKVRVNCVTLGLVRTEQAHLHYGDEAGIAAIGQTIPLGHIADPEEAAGPFLFLASPLARYVTGANLVAHGGGERPAFLSAANVSH